MGLTYEVRLDQIFSNKPWTRLNNDALAEAEFQQTNNNVNTGIG